MFKPTFLYIKQHCITGLLYFGKTTNKNVENYQGSGLYWKKHLKEHGKQTVTLWYCLFTDEISCTEFARSFSRLHDIVESEEWANLIEENGLDGAPVGHPSFITDQEEVSRKISLANLKAWSDPDYREKMIESQKNSWTEERKEKQSIISKNLWTEERKIEHSNKMKGRKGSKALKGKPKSEEHNIKNSKALKGKPKSKEHIEKMKLPKNRVCRLTDKKEMSVNHFTRWLNSIVEDEPLV